MPKCEICGKPGKKTYCRFGVIAFGKINVVTLCEECLKKNKEDADKLEKEHGTK